MTVRTSAGSKLRVSAGTPATFNVSGYSALTFATIGEITDLGEFGREFALVTHNPIGTRGTQKFKGSFNEGTMTLSLGLDEKDAGQVLMKIASNSDAPFAFELETQSGDTYYFQAMVMSWKVGVGSVDSITTATTTLELTTSNTGVGVVEDLAV